MRDDVVSYHKKCSGLTWEVHSVRGDATNSHTLMDRKVHSAEVVSLYSIPIQPDEEDQPARVRCAYPDSRLVPLQCGAVELRATYLVHIGCVGVHSWLESYIRNPMGSEDEADACHIRVLVYDAISFIST